MYLHEGDALAPNHALWPLRKILMQMRDHLNAHEAGRGMYKRLDVQDHVIPQNDGMDENKIDDNPNVPLTFIDAGHEGLTRLLEGVQAKLDASTVKLEESEQKRKGSEKRLRKIKKKLKASEKNPEELEKEFEGIYFDLWPVPGRKRRI